MKERQHRPSTSSALPWDRVFASPPATGEFNISTLPTPEEIIDFPTLDIADAVEEWNLALVGYSLGKRPFYESLLNAVKKLWDLKGNIKLISLSDGFFLFKFSCREDFEMVWNKGAWFIFGKPFIFRKWTSHFSPKREDFTSVPIWFKIHDLPLCCWTPVGISKIATKIGAPVAVDSLTASKSRLTYARVCVLVDASATYPAFVPITVEGKLFNLVIQYEWRPSICDFCKSFNHTSEFCPTNPNPKPTAVLPPKPPRDRSTNRSRRPPSNNPTGILPTPSPRTSSSPGKSMPVSHNAISLPNQLDIPSSNLTNQMHSATLPTSPVLPNFQIVETSLPNQPHENLVTIPTPPSTAIIPNLNSPNLPSSSTSDPPPEQSTSPPPKGSNQLPPEQSNSPPPKCSNQLPTAQSPLKSSSPNKFNLLNLFSDSEATSSNNLEACINDHSLADLASSSYGKKTSSSSSKPNDQPHKNTRGKNSKKGPKSNSKS
ncbi:mucin-5AC-like [Dendrobium catenatum]|uniref:mucin-5AC-like n=1 Tax=Dendrobium catenatum TaxID=906689 RepID=UPI0010A0ACAF|nr:mucin-5AC-like [Dendrobium catenatum]